jgi:hypothetical protein
MRAQFGGKYKGVLPPDERGNRIITSEEEFENLGGDACELEWLTDRYRQRPVTAYHVMLKTLQQARMEGIWRPAMDYEVKWGNTFYLSTGGGISSLLDPTDVGVFSASPTSAATLERKRFLTL